MSVLAISDLIFGDVLSEHNLKPWWEKIRGYLFAGDVVCALFLLYFTWTGVGLNCLPVPQNETVTAMLSTSEVAPVNTYCGNQLPFYVSYCGTILVAMTVIILVTSNLWLHVPGVSGSFCTFAEFDKTVSELDMTLQDLKETCVKPLIVETEEERQEAFTKRPIPIHNKKSSNQASSKPLLQISSEANRKLRKACMLLWKYECKTDIRRWYFRSRKGLAALLLTCALFSCVMAVRLGMDGDRFRCTRGDDLDVAEDIEYFTCFFSTIVKLCVFTTVFASTTVAQAVVVLYGLRKVQEQNSLPIHFEIENTQTKKAKKITTFMANFWKNASPVRSGTLQKFVQYLFSKDCRTAMTPHMKDAVIAKDLQLIAQYATLGGNMIDITETMLESVDVKNTEGAIILVLEQIKYKIDDCEQFVKVAKKEKRWGLLAAALDNCDYPEKFEVPWLKTLDLNFDEIAGLPYVTNSDKLAGSLLYYALSDEYRKVSPDFFATRFLLSNICDQRVYVHFRGKSMSLKDFLTEKKIPENCLKLEKELQKLEAVSTPSKSQDEIKEIFKVYRSAGGENTYQGDEWACKMLSRYKFRDWDKDAWALAHLSSQRIKSSRACCVLVKLMNAYIVTEQNRTNVRELNCGDIIIGDPTDLLIRLFSMLQEEEHFTQNAIRHILSSCDDDERTHSLAIVESQNKLSSDVKNAVKEFVNELNADERILPPEELERLTELEELGRDPMPRSAPSIRSPDDNETDVPEHRLLLSKHDSPDEIE